MVQDKLWYCSLAGRYENPIPPRCLAPIDFLKIPAQSFIFKWGAAGWGGGEATLDSVCTLSRCVCYRRLTPKFQRSLSAVTLGIFLCGSDAPPPDPEDSEKKGYQQLLNLTRSDGHVFLRKIYL
jgi:hypothetical protein